jgi:hypothetical protein
MERRISVSEVGFCLRFLELHTQCNVLINLGKV